MHLLECVARLEGLIDGMDIDTNTKEGKVLHSIVETLRAMAVELKQLRDDHDDLDDFVNSIDTDLNDLEETLLEDYEEDSESDEDDDLYIADSDYDAEDSDSDDDATVEYSCPHCGETISFPVEGFDFEKDYRCPHCGKSLFPEDMNGLDQ